MLLLMRPARQWMSTSSSTSGRTKTSCPTTLGRRCSTCTGPACLASCLSHLRAGRLLLFMPATVQVDLRTRQLVPTPPPTPTPQGKRLTTCRCSRHLRVQSALHFTARLAALCERHCEALRDFTGERGPPAALDVGCAVGGASFELARAFPCVPPAARVPAAAAAALHGSRTTHLLAANAAVIGKYHN